MTNGLLSSTSQLTTNVITFGSGLPLAVAIAAAIETQAAQHLHGTSSINSMESVSMRKIMKLLATSAVSTTREVQTIPEIFLNVRFFFNISVVLFFLVASINQAYLNIWRVLALGPLYRSRIIKNNTEKFLDTATKIYELAPSSSTKNVKNRPRAEKTENKKSASSAEWQGGGGVYIATSRPFSPTPLGIERLKNVNLSCLKRYLLQMQHSPFLNTVGDGLFSTWNTETNTKTDHCAHYTASGEHVCPIYVRSVPGAAKIAEFGAKNTDVMGSTFPYTSTPTTKADALHSSSLGVERCDEMRGSIHIGDPEAAGVVRKQAIHSSESENLLIRLLSIIFGICWGGLCTVLAACLSPSGAARNIIAGGKYFVGLMFGALAGNPKVPSIDTRDVKEIANLARKGYNDAKTKHRRDIARIKYLEDLRFALALSGTP